MLLLFPVYDVSSKQSFMKLDQWINELETHSTKHDIVTMLVGNKIDKVVTLIVNKLIMSRPRKTWWDCMKANMKSFCWTQEEAPCMGQVASGLGPSWA